MYASTLVWKILLVLPIVFIFTVVCCWRVVKHVSFCVLGYAEKAFFWNKQRGLLLFSTSEKYQACVGSDFRRIPRKTAEISIFALKKMTCFPVTLLVRAVFSRFLTCSFSYINKPNPVWTKIIGLTGLHCSTNFNISFSSEMWSQGSCKKMLDS